MSSIEVLEKKSVSMAELKDELARIKKRDGELSFRAAKTEEYLNDFKLIKPKQAQEIFEKIEKLGIPRLKDAQINKIIDTMPVSVAEAKVVLQGYSIPITNDNLTKIVEIVAEYAGDKK
ncbi:hypothetical protein JW711_06235 [Candidatus Woesearchaeota archaeon]|nr:hypothetical protein [Candidatus Woesearchaeota archaeon]